MKRTISFFNPDRPKPINGDAFGFFVKNTQPKRRLSQNAFVFWFIILTLVFVPMNIVFGRNLGELMRQAVIGESPFYSSLTYLIPTLIAFVYLMLMTFVASRRRWALKKKTKWLWALPILALVAFDIIIIKWLYAGFALTWLVAVWPGLVLLSILVSLTIAFKKNKR